MRTIIRYLGIALVIVGILLVMKNLFKKETSWSEENNQNTTTYYTAKIKLLDKETNDYLKGAKLVLKDKDNKTITEWTTEAKTHSINKLKKGQYTLVQTKAPENYHLNENSITFEIKKTNKEIVMYNKRMTKEEIKESNTTKEEVGVDNTSSSKGILTTIISIVTIALGLSTIYKTKKNY